jgi:hypothetical protein
LRFSFELAAFVLSLFCAVGFVRENAWEGFMEGKKNELMQIEIK